MPAPSETAENEFYGEDLVARVSPDGTIGIDHPTDADWHDILARHIALRDRLNERIAEQENCPFRPKESPMRNPTDPEFLLFYQPPCGKWYVHSHKLYGSFDLARQAARKFLEPGTPISILPLRTDHLHPELVTVA